MQAGGKARRLDKSGGKTDSWGRKGGGMATEETSTKDVAQDIAINGPYLRLANVTPPVAEMLAANGVPLSR